MPAYVRSVRQLALRGLQDASFFGEVFPKDRLQPDDYLTLVERLQTAEDPATGGSFGEAVRHVANA